MESLAKYWKSVEKKHIKPFHDFTKAGHKSDFVRWQQTEWNMNNSLEQPVKPSPISPGSPLPAKYLHVTLVSLLHNWDSPC